MELETIYRTIFQKAEKDDYERIEFLERVVSGKYPFGDQLVDLEDAIEMEGIDYTMCDGFDYPTERHLGEIEAIRATREWYKRFGSKMQEDKEEIRKALMTAELTSVLETLDDCLKVLRAYWEETGFMNLLEASAQSPKKYRTSAIYATAETLLNTIENQNSRKKIFKFVEKYEKELVKDFNRAVKTGKIIQIADAYMELSFTHEPELMAYAKKALRH